MAVIVAIEQYNEMKKALGQSERHRQRHQRLFRWIMLKRGR